MRKEVLVAIVLGFALGLVITFGIWSANKALREKEEIIASEEGEEEITTSVQNTPTPIQEFSLAIITPEDESLQSKEKITLTGTTEQGANVVVISEREELILEADSNGRFETEVTLVSGTNEITVAASSTSGEATKTLNIVYSTAEI